MGISCEAAKEKRCNINCSNLNILFINMFRRGNQLLMNDYNEMKFIIICSFCIIFIVTKKMYVIFIND
jgi:hypothetical protein